jgi:murein L,D-transpeptidase YcbB/YkuD
MTETVVFSGSISSVVFSPYWIVLSIIENEIKQAIFQDKIILNLMKWNGIMEASYSDLG